MKKKIFISLSLLVIAVAGFVIGYWLRGPGERVINSDTALLAWPDPSATMKAWCRVVPTRKVELALFVGGLHHHPSLNCHP